MTIPGELWYMACFTVGWVMGWATGILSGRRYR